MLGGVRERLGVGGAWARREGGGGSQAAEGGVCVMPEDYVDSNSWPRIPLLGGMYKTF